jgi:putative transposase
MSIPRQVLPNRMYMITRRTFERRFMMQPNAKVRQILAYCIGEAAKRFDIEVVLPMALSNHHHTIVFDRYGRILDFVQHLHTMIARCLNALRGRHDYVWSSGPPCITELADEGAFMEKLVYVATNPVKHFLVEHAHHWPGFHGVNELLNGTAITAERPRVYFSAKTGMPASVTYTLAIPPEFDHEGILEELRQRIADAEAEFARKRLSSGRRIVGRGQILRQSYDDMPATPAPPCDLRPRVAARNADVRVKVLQRNAEFVRAYRAAYAALGTDRLIPFPEGTYRRSKKYFVLPS